MTLLRIEAEFMTLTNEQNYNVFECKLDTQRGAPLAPPHLRTTSADT